MRILRIMPRLVGAAFILPDGTEINSLSGFAYWNPSVGGIQYRKGGVGTYHMEYEYKVNAQGSETYPALRKAIQFRIQVLSK